MNNPPIIKPLGQCQGQEFVKECLNRIMQNCQAPHWSGDHVSRRDRIITLVQMALKEMGSAASVSERETPKTLKLTTTEFDKATASVSESLNPQSGAAV